MGNVILSVPRIVRSAIFSTNRLFPSSRGSLYQNEVKCSAFEGNLFYNDYKGESCECYGSIANCIRRRLLISLFQAFR